MSADVLIAGAGIAGLTAARDLLRAGARVTVFEAADRVGGQVASQRIAGVDLDAAAESFALRDDTVATLVRELGLGDRIVTPRPAPAWLIRDDGTSGPLPATGLLGVPSDLHAADVRDALGEDGTARALVDRTLPARVGADATSFGALVRARMGDAVVQRLVAPITRGVHSKEPDALAVEAAHPRLRGLLVQHGSLAAAIGAIRAAAPAGSAVASLDGGIHTLVTALANDVRELGGTIRTGARVSAATPHGVTVDATEHRGLVLRAHAPARIPTRTIRLATLVVEAPELDEAPRGTGVLIAAETPGIHARALTHVTAKWAWAADALQGLHVLRLSYDGDAGDPAVHAVADAEAVFGTSLRVHTPPHVVAWKRANLAAKSDTVPATGESVSGTGLAAVIAHARSTAATLASADPADEHRTDPPLTQKAS